MIMPVSSAKTLRMREENYVGQIEARLLNDLRAQMLRDRQADEWVRANRVHDRELARRMVAAGLTEESYTALASLPSVMVAWADGSVTCDERDIVVQACQMQSGVVSEAAIEQLRRWLQRKPIAIWWDLWVDYTRDQFSAMPSLYRKLIAEATIHHCIAVAAASGGALGFGAISDREQAVIRRIEIQVMKLCSEAPSK